MEVHFNPETEKGLGELAAQNGRANAAELVQSVVEGYFDELTQTREMLGSRHGDLKSGRVTAIPGDVERLGSHNSFSVLVSTARSGSYEWS
jgi:hypothetical protein